MNSKIKIITTKIIEILTKFWVAVPILFGILLPMVYMFPLAFTSWWLFGSFEHTSWLNCYLVLDYHRPVVYIALYLIEGIIFLTGTYLFVAGLITLTKSRLSKLELTKSGIYKHIRHPQNIGILLMILPFSLYLGRELKYDIGIRIGEVVSWFFLAYLFGITSILEERKLLKKFGEEYINYLQSTGFFFPKICKS